MSPDIKVFHWQIGNMKALSNMKNMELVPIARFFQDLPRTIGITW